jgi:predicted ArsR family transcriptional regulator
MMISVANDSTKSRVLYLLRGSGRGTAQAVASTLEISAPAARRHLMDLEADGLIESQVERPGGRGRPQHVFKLSSRGEEHFPKRYAQLCDDILEHVQSLYGSGAVLEVLDARNAKLLEVWRDRVQGESLETKLEALVCILNEIGYEARLEIAEPGVFYLLEGNCPSLEVARKYPQLCQSESNLYAHVLDANVTREQQISTGASACRYRIEALPEN